MAPALSADNYIYEGIWTNWDRGPVTGLTLTVNPSQASILSPALALLISIGGAQLWRLFQFALHQCRATPEARPMIYHQTQATLRNSTTDLNTLWRFIRIAVAWRHQGVGVLRSLGPLTFWTFIHTSLVLVLGLFSSRLLETNDEVLSRSPWCGTFNQTYWNEVYSTNQSDPNHARLVKEFNQYTNSRYANAQQHVDICNTIGGNCKLNEYRPNALNWTSIIAPDVCPFNSSVCQTDVGSITMDTGFLSSFSDFGFNAARKDRVSVRMMTTCAPLNYEQYTTKWENSSATSGVRQIADALYGHSVYNLRNATYTAIKPDLECEQRSTTNPYLLVPEIAIPGGSVANGLSSFDPIQELRPTKADLSLLLLLFNDAYENPVDDAWFSAQQVADDPTAYCMSPNKTVYVRDYPVTSMACMQQWQFCNAEADLMKNDSCIPLQSLTAARLLIPTPASPISLSPRQLATALAIGRAARTVTLYYLVIALSQSTSPPLRARSEIANSVGPALPSDQWQTESKYWMDLLLAYWQQTSLDYSTGQMAADTSYINLTKPSHNHSDAVQDAAYWACQAQVIQSATYRNFNFLSLLLTLVLCTITIILGIWLEDCVGYLRQRKQRYTGPAGKSKQDMWVANSDLDMLRTVDEIKNRTPWTLSRNGIPLTHAGYQVSINNLLAQKYDVEEGSGILLPAVKRVRTEQQAAKNKRNLLSHSYNTSRDSSGTFLTRDTSMGHNISSFSANTPSMPLRDRNNGSYPDMVSDKEPPATVFEAEPLNSGSTLTFSNTIELDPITTETRTQPRSDNWNWPWLGYTTLPQITDNGLDYIGGNSRYGPHVDRDSGDVL